MLLQVAAVVFGALLVRGDGIVPGPVFYGADPMGAQQNDVMTCDPMKFTMCKQQFITQLNFTTPSTYTDLAHQVGNLMENQGVPGFNALCGAMEDFVFCLGLGNDAAVSACYNVPYLVSQGVSAAEAAGEVGLYTGLRFQCGAGYQVMLNNYQCIMTVSAQQAGAMQTCQDTFTANMQANPNNKCNNLGMLLDCDSSLYAPCSQQTVWQQCTTMTSNFFVAMPDCAATVSCSGAGAQYPGKGPMQTTTAGPQTTFLFSASIDDQGRPWNPAYGDISSPTAQSLAFLYSREIYQTVQSAFPTATIQVTGFMQVKSYTRLSATIRIHLLGEQTNVPTAAAIQAAIIAGAAANRFQWATITVQSQGAPTPAPQVGTSQGWEDAAAMFASSIDVTVDPCQDFFKFSCGQWQATHPLPAHANSVSNFGQMYDDLLGQVATQLDNYKDDGSSYSLSQAKVFWNICLQSPNMPLSGQSVISMLSTLGGWPMIQQSWADSQMTEIGQLMGKLTSQYGLNTFLSAYVDTDWKNPINWLFYVDQATLFYPTIYYQNSQISNAALTSEGNYMFGLAKQLASINNQLNGAAMPTDAQINKDVNDVVQMEYAIAMKMKSDDDRRVNARMYNKFTMQTASARWTFLNWNNYLTSVASNYFSPTVVTQGMFDVQELEYMDSINTMLGQYPKRVLQNYFMFRLVDTQASFLPDLKDEYLKFKHETEGVTALPPIEYSCADSLINAMPYIGGRLYVDSHFKHLRGDPRGGLATMTVDVQNQFRVMLQNLPWMDQVTKQAAFDKLSNYVRNYAFPDWLMNNTLLDAVHPKMFFNLSPQDNIQAANTKLIQYNNWYQFRTLAPGFPVDRTSFVSTPATINAFYAPEFNSITILAGIMNPPFFRADFPQAVNFGGLGLVIGHETTHGFDDQGVQWNGVGNLTNWIDNQSNTGFKAMAQCVIDEYNSFCYPNITPSCINGVQTQGENIADNGGIRAAYYGYKSQIALRGPEPRLPGVMSQYSMDQIYFIAFAQGWCENASPQRISRQLLIDPHSPGEWRVKGAVRNMQEFADAFNCPAGSFEAPANRCNVWH
uniref:Endothelin-converting enzyme 1 n=1 Tax=Plectus sambesii TaxID=2011161 RepID=A0A914XF97_9BILA